MRHIGVVEVVVNIAVVFDGQGKGGIDLILRLRRPERAIDIAADHLHTPIERVGDELPCTVFERAWGIEPALLRKGDQLQPDLRGHLAPGLLQALKRTKASRAVDLAVAACPDGAVLHAHAQGAPATLGHIGHGKAGFDGTHRTDGLVQIARSAWAALAGQAFVQVQMRIDKSG